MKIMYVKDSLDFDMWHSYTKVGDHMHHMGTLHCDTLNEIMDSLLGFNISNLPEGDDRFIINFTKASFEVV